MLSKQSNRVTVGIKCIGIIPDAEGTQTGGVFNPDTGKINGFQNIVSIFTIIALLVCDNTVPCKLFISNIPYGGLTLNETISQSVKSCGSENVTCANCALVIAVMNLNLGMNLFPAVTNSLPV